jgi:hypothetical protein
LRNNNAFFQAGRKRSDFLPAFSKLVIYKNNMKMKRNRKYWLFVLLLILGGQISAQENKSDLFAPFIVSIDFDKESFLIGTLNDYEGRKQTFTVGLDTANSGIKLLEKSAEGLELLQQAKKGIDHYYQLVDSYYPQEKNIALLIQSLFSDEFLDLYVLGTEGVALHSASLTEVINGYYDYTPLSSRRTIFADTIYSGRLKPERFETVRQKLSFLAGAFLRDGYQTEERGYHLSMPNSLSKAKLCAALLNEFDCTNVVHEVFKGYIPAGNIVCFEPSETIRKLIEWVKTMKGNLKSNEVTRKCD